MEVWFVDIGGGNGKGRISGVSDAHCNCVRLKITLIRSISQKCKSIPVWYSGLSIIVPCSFAIPQDNTNTHQVVPSINCTCCQHEA